MCHLYKLIPTMPIERTMLVRHVTVCQSVCLSNQMSTSCSEQLYLTQFLWTKICKEFTFPTSIPISYYRSFLCFLLACLSVCVCLFADFNKDFYLFKKKTTTTTYHTVLSYDLQPFRVGVINSGQA